MTSARDSAFPRREGSREEPVEPWHARLTEVHEVPVAVVRPADSPRAVAEDADHLRTMIVSERALPPITVHRPTMRVIDGTHRLKAAVLRGHTEVEVRFFDGSAEDAFVLAVESNTTHGLPLTLAERSTAARRILVSHPHWADRAIASVAGLSAHTVAALRREEAAGDGPAGARVGRDGRVRPLNTASARREAGRLLAESPETSLRGIAGLTGLSPATVRDVRDRVSRGEDPVPPRQRAAEPDAGQRHAADGQFRPAGRNVAAGAGADVETAYRNLCRDPALRHNETGRQLLRLLGVLVRSPDEWRSIADTVPTHRTSVVADLALECARLWQEFADTTRNRAT